MDKLYVVLLANDRPGVKVAKFLRESGENLVRNYLHENEKQTKVHLNS